MLLKSSESLADRRGLPLFSIERRWMHVQVEHEDLRNKRNEIQCDQNMLQRIVVKILTTQ